MIYFFVSNSLAKETAAMSASRFYIDVAVLLWLSHFLFYFKHVCIMAGISINCKI